MDFPEILKLVGTFLGGAIALYLAHQASTKAEKKEQADCLDRINLNMAENSLHIMQGAQNHEKLADHVSQRITNLENKVNQFENIVPEVNALKMEMKMYTGKMDNLIDVVKESKADNKEAIKEIKEMIKNQHTH
jgi:gas vesicle protein